MVNLSRTLTLHHCGLWIHEIQVGNIEFCLDCVLSSITFTVHIHLNGNRPSWRSLVVQNWLGLQRSFDLCFKCLTRPFESPLLFMHHSLHLFSFQIHFLKNFAQHCWPCTVCPLTLNVIVWMWNLFKLQPWGTNKIICVCLAQRESTYPLNTV